MCLACHQMSCVGVLGCSAIEPGWVSTLSAAPAGVVRDYTALLAYVDYPQARFNARLPDPGAPVFVTYGFFDAGNLPDSANSPYATSGYVAFDAAQRASARLALEALSAVAGVVFVETGANAAMIGFHGANDTPWAGWANYPSVSNWQIGQGTVVIDQAGSYAPGSAAFQVVLHELGHAVGLKHPFSGTNTLPSDLDRTSQTLMSYEWDGRNYSVYSPLDVQALQHLYGTPGGRTGWTWRMEADVLVIRGAGAGDTILGVRSANRIDGLAGNDLILGGDAADTLWGGDGNDTLRGMGGDNLVIGGAGDDRMEGGAVWTGNRYGNETLWGGAGNDTVDLQQGNNEVWAGPGNDTVLGGSGTDILGGGAGDDRIEARYGQRNQLWGGDGQDTLIVAAWGDSAGGGTGHDSVQGGNGFDTLYGGAGNDTVSGGFGADALYLGRDNDMGYGGSSNDTLFAGPGFDRLWGGSGADRFEFWRGYGWNRIEDFNLAEADRIALGSGMWTGSHGVLTRAQVIETFGRMTAGGDAVLDFAAAETVVVVVGAGSLANLSNALILL